MICLANLIVLLAPQGIWGNVAERWNRSFFPTGYRVIDKEKP